MSQTRLTTDPNLGEYFKFLQSGVEGEVVSLQQHVVNIVEIFDQIVPYTETQLD